MLLKLVLLSLFERVVLVISSGVALLLLLLWC